MKTSISKPLFAAAGAGLGLMPVLAFAQDAAAPAADAVVEMAAATVDKGDTTWMMVSTILVILMTLPGLALFYGGLVRAKNVLSVLMQVFAGFSLMALLWVMFGYSLAFGGNAVPGLEAFVFDFSKFMLNGVTPDSTAATFTAGVEIPELTFIAFQLTFAGITPALIVGAIAERMKFGAVMLFLAIWFVFAYIPMAHMVWAGGGFLYEMGAYDFAGGTVVHINAGIAGLVAAIILGPRKGFLKEQMPPHSLTLTLIGACLLWVGWFGFNAGSNLEATGLAAQALLNTIVATAAAAIAWAVVERLMRGHASLLGAASGAVAGLVAITPAAGFAGVGGSMVLGAVAGVICLFAVVSLKPMFKYDDSLDVFGVHGVGGIVGAIGTAIVASPALGGYPLPGYEMGAQLTNQITAVVVAIVWSAVVAAIAMIIVKFTIGLRVTDQAENDGLDLSSHGERAYN